MKKPRVMSLLLSSVFAVSLINSSNAFFAVNALNDVKYGAVEITVIDEETGELFKEDRKCFDMIGWVKPKEGQEMAAGAIHAGSWNPSESNPYVKDELQVNFQYGVKYIGKDYDGYSYDIDDEKSESIFEVTENGKKEVKLYMKKNEWKKKSIYFITLSTSGIMAEVGVNTGITLQGYDDGKSYEVGESPIKFTIDDESIAKITQVQGKLVNVMGVAWGKTVLHAETPDGQKASVNVNIVEVPPVVSTTAWINDTVTTTTTVVTTPPPVMDYMTKVDYDKSPMQVGEMRRIDFGHPNGDTVGGSVYSDSDIIEIIYDKGTNFFYVKALKEGEASISVHARGCAFDPTVTITVEGEQELPDFAPTVEFNASDMKVGETREGRFYNPVSNTARNGKIKHSDNVEVECDEDGNFKVTALKAGGASLEITESNCPFVAHVSFNINENESEITRIQPYATTTTTTTVNVITTTTADTSQGTYCSYDGTPLNAGQKISLGFGCTNKDIPLLDGGSVESDSDNIIVSYNSGLNSFEVTAVKEGTGHVYAEARGADTGIDIYINVVSDSKLKGDANCDGGMDMADVVYIMQSLANPDKYKLSKFGRENADLDGNGVTVGDAQKIQRKLLGYDDDAAPTTPTTLPVGAETTEEAIKLIKNYDLNDYYEGYRDSLKDMFESFKKDGYIYSFAEKENSEKEIKSDTDFGGSKIWLMPRMSYEDKGIMYHVRSGAESYQVYYYFIDPEYAELDMKAYAAERLNIKNTQTIGDKYVLAELGDSDLIVPNVFFKIDDSHYCKVRGNVSESEMTSFLENLTSVKIPLNEASENYPFEAEYVRVYGTGTYNREPVIEKFNSEEEFIKRFNSNSEGSKYDEKWFSEHKLILITLEEGSGSIRHKVTELTADHVAIDRITSQVMTCDWAIWRIYIELDKDAAISDNFSAVITETETA